MWIYYKEIFHIQLKHSFFILKIMYILILTKYTKCGDVEQIPYIMEHTIHTQIMEHKIQVFVFGRRKQN